MPQLIRFYHNDINLHRLRVKGGIVCACVRGGGDQMVELQKGEILKFSNEASRVFQILLLNNSFSSALPPRPPFSPALPLFKRVFVTQMSFLRNCLAARSNDRRMYFNTFGITMIIISVKLRYCTDSRDLFIVMTSCLSVGSIPPIIALLLKSFL